MYSEALLSLAILGIVLYGISLSTLNISIWVLLIVGVSCLSNPFVDGWAIEALVNNN